MDSAFTPSSARPAGRLLPASIDLSASLLKTAEWLCLGGASLIVMAFCSCLANLSFIMRPEIRNILGQCAAASLFFSVIFSYTHTMWSYRFAYQQGLPYLRRHILPLAGYPAFLFFLLLLCACTWSLPVAQLSGIYQIEKLFSLTGIALNWSKYSSLGELLLSLLLVAQITISGYHYGMQALGIAIASAEKHGYSLKSAQKQCLRMNIFALWLVNLLSGFTFLSILDSQCFIYKPVRFPWHWQAAAACLFALSIAMVIGKIVIPNIKTYRRLPPFAAGLTMVSLWLWLQPYFQPYGFQIGVVPLAHGLQYLYFAGRAESNGFQPAPLVVAQFKNQLRPIYILMLFALLAASGYAAFKAIPVMLDAYTSINGLAPNFYIMAAYVFFNLHHYMIDSVVWRGDSRLKTLMPDIPA